MTDFLKGIGIIILVLGLVLGLYASSTVWATQTEHYGKIETSFNFAAFIIIALFSAIVCLVFWTFGCLLENQEKQIKLLAAMVGITETEKENVKDPS